MTNSRPQAVADVAAVTFIPFPVASDCPAAPGVYENGFTTGSMTVPGNKSVTATATIYYSERRGMGKVDPQSVSFPSYVIGLTVGGAVYPTHTLYQAVYK